MKIRNVYLTVNSKYRLKEEKDIGNQKEDVQEFISGRHTSSKTIVKNFNDDTHVPYRQAHT